MARTAPSVSQAFVFQSLPTVTMTLAPNAAPIWIAVVPMPLAPPCTSSHSPGLSAARSNTLCQTVNTVSGRAAASTKLSPGGRGRVVASGATAYSA